MLRGVVYRLIGYLASKGHCSIWKLFFVLLVSVILHLSSTPSISGPGSATELIYIVCQSVCQDMCIYVSIVCLSEHAHVKEHTCACSDRQTDTCACSDRQTDRNKNTHVLTDRQTLHIS